MKCFNMPELKEKPAPTAVTVPLTNNEQDQTKAKPYQIDIENWQLRATVSNMTTITTSGTQSLA